MIVTTLVMEAVEAVEAAEVTRVVILHKKTPRVNLRLIRK
jgi:hypothetical protein